jgi:hypothetical protein
VEGYVQIRTNRLELVFVEGYVPIRTNQLDLVFLEGYVPIRTNRLELVFVEGYIPILGIISRFLLWIKNAHQNPSLFIIETIQHRFCASILGFHDMNSFYNSLNIMKSLASTPIQRSKD